MEKQEGSKDVPQKLVLHYAPDSNQDWEHISKELHVPKEYLRQQNPSIKTGYVPKGQEIRVTLYTGPPKTGEKTDKVVMHYTPDSMQDWDYVSKQLHLPKDYLQQQNPNIKTGYVLGGQEIKATLYTEPLKTKETVKGSVTLEGPKKQETEKPVMTTIPEKQSTAMTQRKEESVTLNPSEKKVEKEKQVTTNVVFPPVTKDEKEPWIFSSYFTFPVMAVLLGAVIVLAFLLARKRVIQRGRRESMPDFVTRCECLPKERPVQCPECDAIIKAANIKKHIAKHHPISGSDKGSIPIV